MLAQVEDIQQEMDRAKHIGESTCVSSIVPPYLSHPSLPLSWKECFVVPANFRRIALGFILQFSVQLTGVSAIQYYSTTIFTTMGFSNSRILLFQSINSVIALIGEACCVIWVDRTGRRLPLIVGNIASGLSFVVGTILMARWPGTVDK